jgi:hypothetical protein
LVQREKVEENKVLQDSILAILRTERHGKVEDLIAQIKQTNPAFSVEEIQEAIESLQDQGKVSLADPPIKGSFVNYIFDFAATMPFWLSMGAIAICLMTIFIFPNVEPFNILRVVTGGIISLFLPGYGLVGLIFAKKGLPQIESLGVSCILSIAVVFILWLSLDNSPFGGGINSTVGFTSAISAILMIASTYRQFKLGKTSNWEKIGDKN